MSFERTPPRSSVIVWGYGDIARSPAVKSFEIGVQRASRAPPCALHTLPIPETLHPTPGQMSFALWVNQISKWKHSGGRWEYAQSCDIYAIQLDLLPKRVKLTELTIRTKFSHRTVLTNTEWLNRNHYKFMIKQSIRCSARRASVHPGLTTSLAHPVTQSEQRIWIWWITLATQKT